MIRIGFKNAFEEHINMYSSFYYHSGEIAQAEDLKRTIIQQFMFLMINSSTL